ncbi:Ff.00g043790.m01.CDS01 [Fusarium sp. VM40]|nr:Ff.00g043790.m01.CDS01 [Fusarium sp. VM40]
MDLLKRHGGHGHGHEEEEHGHGHGHQSEDGLRQHFLACLYWYVLATVLIAGSVSRLVSAFVAKRRIKRRDMGASSDTSISTVERLLDAPKTLVSRLIPRPVRFATLPVRKTIVVVAYTAFVSLLVTYKSIKHDANFHERIAFRAAWITATQTSLPFLLAVRVNPIGLLLGTSSERINWFHRWASRVFFASATVHGGFFTYEWLAASFFWTEVKTVKMVLPGIGAWFILAWTVVSTIPFFRRIKYELFVVQHIISVVLLLVFLVLHVPDHHLFSIWCAVGVFAYDVVTRSANPIWRNLRLRVSANPSVRYAHDANVEAVDDELTVMTIRNVGFSWVPGQHVLIWSATFRWETPHPFTIVNSPSAEAKTQDVQLTMKTKTGLTRDLNDWARRTGLRGDNGSMRVLVTGPFGTVPNWKQYENIVLVAASTGGSFTTPILEDLLTSQSPGCVRKISALYIVRHKTHAEPYLQRIARVLSRAKEMGISANIQVAVTRGSGTVSGAVLHDDANASRERLIEPETTRGASVELERFSLDSARSSESGREEQLLKEEVDLGLDGVYASSVEHTEGRPEIAKFMRMAVGSIPGNVAVAVCGGETIEKVVKTSVASIRTERNRDGMGTSDIYLHVERSDM